MLKQCRAWGLWVAGCVGCVAVSGAPLDALLSANPDPDGRKLYVEVASDRMNGDLDFFHVRDRNPDTAGTPAGDYNGAHLLVGAAPWEGVWLNAGLWNRALQSSSDSYNYQTWQLAGQYRFWHGAGAVPAMALRASAWSNQASSTESSTAVVVPGAKLNSAKISDPQDHNVQLDWIGTWTPTPSSTVTLVLGGGSTQLSYGALTATTTRDGCNYNLRFNGNAIFGSLAEPCKTAGPVVEQFYDSSGDYGVDVDKELAWQGRFAHIGLSSTWQQGPWSVLAAYWYTTVQRGDVDAIVRSRGGTAYTENQRLTLQLDYRLAAHLKVFGRAELSNHLLLDTLALSYNASTAYRFDSKYSLFTAGLVFDF
jgi:hypothetical protein